jgi:hypothetical protein
MRFILDISLVDKEKWENVSHASFYKSCHLQIPLKDGEYQKDMDIDYSRLNETQRRAYEECRKVSEEMFPEKNKEWPTGINLRQLPENSKLIITEK